MLMEKQQYEEDLNIYKELKQSAIKLTTQSMEATFINANPKTVPYKKLISTLNLISVRLDNLHEDVKLASNGMIMLETALSLDNISTITYKGAVSDLFHRWISFLNGRITYCTNQIQRLSAINFETAVRAESEAPEKVEQAVKKVTKTAAIASGNTDDDEYEDNIHITSTEGSIISKDNLNAKRIELDIPLNRPIHASYTHADLQEIYETNMTKILDILAKGQLVYGTPEFDNILLYISNIYEVIKAFDFDSDLLSKTDFQVLRRVRICTCHNLYKDSSSIIEVCTAIGVLVSMTCKLKA